MQPLPEEPGVNGNLSLNNIKISGRISLIISNFVILLFNVPLSIYLIVTSNHNIVSIP